MDALELVLIIETGDNPKGYSEDDVLAALSEHREELRRLQGSWGRFIAHLEETEAI